MITADGLPDFQSGWALSNKQVVVFVAFVNGRACHWSGASLHVTGRLIVFEALCPDGKSQSG